MLAIKQVEQLIKKAESSFRHQECASCECYLGFLAQMELDGDQEIGNFLAAYKPPRGEIHACLGCDPCPPGVLYADYLRKTRGIQNNPIRKS
jgi:hypothetical protein